MRACLCRGPLNLAPWCYCVPGEVTPFARLLGALGVGEAFTPEQYVRVLGDMAAAAGGRPLSAEQQEQAVSVLQARASPALPLLARVHTGTFHTKPMHSTVTCRRVAERAGPWCGS